MPLPVESPGRAPGPHAPSDEPSDEGRRGDEASRIDALLAPLVAADSSWTARSGRGELVEIAGGESSGRTALAARLAALATAGGELAGWVDLPDALDPRSLARAGADPGALLWVRPPGVKAALRAAELLAKAGFALVVLDLVGAPPRELARAGPPVWTRLARLARQCRTALVLLAHERVAGPSAARAIHTERCRARFEHGLFEGLDLRATLARDRTPADDGAARPPRDLRVFQRPLGA
jgi:hypothetical protein